MNTDSIVAIFSVLKEQLVMAEQPRLERENDIIAGARGGSAARFGWSSFIVRLADMEP